MIISAILCLVFLVTMHELGHAWEMRRQGVEIAEFGIGIPCGSTLRLSFYLERFNCNLVLTPLLLGAYVMPSQKGEEVMRKLPHNKLAMIYAAGPWANLVLAIIFCAISLIMQNQGLTSLGWAAYIAGFSLVVFRKIFSVYLAPLLGWLFLFVTIYGVFYAYTGHIPANEALGGPVSIVKMIAKQNELARFLEMGGVISFSVFAFNCLPLGILDGGRIWVSLLNKLAMPRLAKYSYGGGCILLAVIISLALFNDLISIISK